MEPAVELGKFLYQQCQPYKAPCIREIAQAHAGPTTQKYPNITLGPERGAQHAPWAFVHSLSR